MTEQPGPSSLPRRGATAPSEPEPQPAGPDPRLLRRLAEALSAGAGDDSPTQHH